jgi:hypothetical protein
MPKRNTGRIAGQGQVPGNALFAVGLIEPVIFPWVVYIVDIWGLSLSSLPWRFGLPFHCVLFNEE